MKGFPLLGLALFSLHAYAQDNLDDASAKALSQTTAMLNDAKQRDTAIAQDSNAKSVDDQVKALTKGDPNKQAEVYKMASEAFAKIAAQANGDPEKIQEMLMEAQKNPEAFGQKNLTEDQKKTLRDLASEQKK